MVSFVRKQRDKKDEAVVAAKKLDQGRCPGLDPAVVAAGRQSGFPEDQLQKLAFLARKPVRMDDAPPKKARPKEAEDEEGNGEGSAPVCSSQRS